MNALLRLIGILPALAVRLHPDFGVGLVGRVGEPNTGGPLVAPPNFTHPHFPRYFSRLNGWWISQPGCLVSAAPIPAAWLMDHLPPEASLASRTWIERPGP